MYVGDIIGFDAQAGLVDIEVKNRFVVGDRLQIIQPEGNCDIRVETLLNKYGEAVTEAPGSGITLRMPVNTATIGKLQNAMLARYL